MLIPAATYAEIMRECISSYPREGCGVVTCRKWDKKRMRAYGLMNFSTEPLSRFSVDPDEQVELWNQLDRNGENPVIAFHSHTRPGTEPVPSPDDVENHDPDMMMLIVGLSNPVTPTARLWKIHNGRPVEFPLTVE